MSFESDNFPIILFLRLKYIFFFIFIFPQSYKYFFQYKQDKVLVQKH